MEEYIRTHLKRMDLLLYPLSLTTSEPATLVMLPADVELDEEESDDGKLLLLLKFISAIYISVYLEKSVKKIK
jgi:hypothetical protein